MAKPNWGRGIGMGLSSLGQSMMDRAMMEQRWRQAQELEDARTANDERLMLLRDQMAGERARAEFERDNPYTVPGAMIDRLRYGNAVPVGIPGYQPQDGRTNLQGLLGINRALAPETPEVDALTAYQAEQIRLAEERMALQERLAGMRGAGGGGGADSPYPSGINTTEANRLGTRYFGNLSPTGAGQAGVSAPRDILSMTGEGIGTIDRAKADWFGALEGGLIGPYQQAQADSIVQEQMPPMDLGALGLDEWTGDGFVDRKLIPALNKDITIETARAKLADVVAKSPNKDLTWAMIRNGLREMNLPAEKIAEIVPNLGSVKGGGKPDPKVDEFIKEFGAPPERETVEGGKRYFWLKGEKYEVI